MRFRSLCTVVVIVLALLGQSVGLLHADDGGDSGSCDNLNHAQCCKCEFFFNGEGDEGFTCKKVKMTTNSVKCLAGQIETGFCDTSVTCSYSGGEV